MFDSVKYEQAEKRVLYILIQKRFGSAKNVAKLFSVTPQQVSNWFSVSIPLKYIGYFGRTYKINPALLDYETYLLMAFGKVKTFPELVKESIAFTAEEKVYILKGKYIDPAKFLKASDSKISNRK